MYNFIYIKQKTTLGYLKLCYHKYTILIVSLKRLFILNKYRNYLQKYLDTCYDVSWTFQSMQVNVYRYTI